MRALALFFCAAMVLPAARNIRIENQGAYWHVTVSGTLPARGAVSIVAAGDLTVRGTRSAEIGYTTDTAAPDEAVAQRFARAALDLRADGELIFPHTAAVRIEIPRGTRLLTLVSSTGAVDAADLDGSLRADAVAGRITVDRIGGDVEIRSGGGATLIGSVHGRVVCRSAGGAIRAILLAGDADLETEGGDIRIGEVKGGLRALTGAGGIHVDQAGSRLYAATGGGPIEVNGGAHVECHSAAGSIRLTNVSGRVSASTEEGSIVAAMVKGAGVAESSLTARGGDITVWLASDMSVSVEAASGGWGGARSIAFNGGGPKLRLNASGGRIGIRRQ